MNTDAATGTVLTDEVRALVGVVGPLLTAQAPLAADTLRRFVHAAMETVGMGSSWCRTGCRRSSSRSSDC